MLGCYNLSDSSFWKQCLVPSMFWDWTKLLVLLAFSFTFTHSSQWNRWWRKKKKRGGIWRSHCRAVLHRTRVSGFCQIKTAATNTTLYILYLLWSVFTPYTEQELCCQCQLFTYFLVQHSTAYSVTRAKFGKTGRNREWSGRESNKSRKEKEMAEQKSRVEEDDWTSLLPVCVCVCVYAGTSDRLVSGLSLFHCGLWQLKTHQGRRTDPVTPNKSELEAWAIVTSSSSFWKPIVPWERTTSVPVSCCSRSDKTTLNMSTPPPKYTHTTRKTYDGCTADNFFTHTYSNHLIHTFLLDTLEWKGAQKILAHSERNENTRVLKLSLL